MKSRNILILALIMALVTTYFFSRYLKELDNRYKKVEDKISVVVPKEDIKKYQRITKEILELKEFDVDSVHPEALKSIEEIEGDYSLTDLKKGEVLFQSRFTNQYEEDQLVARKIREGYRAISIEANYVESVSNLIQPEDYVDVVFSEKLKDPEGKEIVNTETLLRDIRVLAVGKRLSEEEPKDPKASSEKEALYTSVTLELKPENIEKIANADERGNIKLTLKSKVAP